jgi:hypothetical protein
MDAKRKEKKRRKKEKNFDSRTAHSNPLPPLRGMRSIFTLTYTHEMRKRES